MEIDCTRVSWIILPAEGFSNLCSPTTRNTCVLESSDTPSPKAKDPNILLLDSWLSWDIWEVHPFPVFILPNYFLFCFCSTFVIFQDRYLAGAC